MTCCVAAICDNGKAIVIVRAKAGQGGTLRLRAKGEGLKGAVVKIASR